MTTIVVHAVKDSIGAMNMNRAECERAYANLEFCREVMRESIERNGEIINPVSSFDKAMVMFARLIDEHFDNPPLKFEELEVGMWVWDNELRMYFLIKGKFNITVGSYKVLEIITSNLSNGTWHYNTCHIYYQENRFYRKQVEG